MNKNGKYYFLEDINYLETSDESIWGQGDAETLEIINAYDFSGKWLNLSSGDGRYNNFILKRAKQVVATDFDLKALKKLEKLTPTDLKAKLTTKQLDLNNVFPFENLEFDGVFNTGTIHLFPVEFVERVFGEIDRVLKVGGKIFIDFACEIKRVTKEGKVMNDERKNYGLAEVKSIFEKCFPNYDLKFDLGEVKPEWVGEQEKPHFFSCKFWIVRGVKNS